jgi:hypothetical protein
MNERLLAGSGLSGHIRLTAFALQFVAIGALVNGMAISYLG